MALLRPASRPDAGRAPASAAERRAATPPGQREPIDAAAVLTVYFTLMLAIPAQATFAPLGSVGAPANVVALGVFVWWVWHHLHRSEPEARFAQPVRRAALALLLLMLVVYRHAMVQPLMSDEVMPADSGLIRFVAVMGIVLAATDGIASKERLHVLVNRITIGAGAVAVVALVQVATGQLWVDRLIPPGLTIANPNGSLIARGAFLRPSGTSVHPIEFGAVLSMLLPLAITRARTTKGRRFWPWFRVAVMLLAVLMSFSRTALICTALVLVTLSVLWSTRARWVAAAVGLVGLAGAAVAVPGLAGTIRGLFAGAANDPSVLSRTAGYDYAWEMFLQNPWFGRGYGTFIPRYYIFDNGYLQFTMETGAIGLAFLVALLVTGMVCAVRTRRLVTARRDRELAQALLAGLLAGTMSIGFFDLFAFPQSAGCLALMLGLSGGFYRLARRRPTV
ncbi:O-antigen ligase family protein [Terracoccus luteus]|uniref:O-antigen ligase n=1 Tax=Terracoccus luteus TaxID=53356 RepID=A0A839PY76_9MICO|nr:O-antigen ligase family protein [Terracoccus luteus]MBB2985732.1 O-antigen ligase [Terracoccus luteus]MCP2171384.1 O-antigen ligase [Terracoccus luteus]